MLSIAVLLVVTATCAVPAGETSTPNGASPRGAAAQTRPDLTNQASPIASTFRDGQSYTPLATPPRGFDLGAYPLEADRVTAEQNRMWTTREARVANSPNGNVNAYVRRFGEDRAGEVYVMVNRAMGPYPATATGEVLKLVPA